MSDAEAAPKTTQPVECPATKDPAVRRFIVAAMCLGMGAYCYVDHYVRGKYPHPGSTGDINDWSLYVFNAYGPVVFGLIGIVATVCGVLAMRRVLVADEDGVGYVGKGQIPWSAVTGLDTSKFDKGILKLIYTQDGAERRLTLDDQKLQNFKALVQLVETKAPDTNSTK